MFRKIVLLLATMCVVSLSACNTMEGAGRDVSSAGQKVEREANEHKGY